MSLNPCSQPEAVQSLNIDSTPPYCGDNPVGCDEKGIPNKNHTSGIDYFDDFTLNKMGRGHNQLCDPMQKGYITNNQRGEKEPDRRVVYAYHKAIDGCDQAMTDMFKDIIVIDEQGKAHTVPIIWGTQEKAVLAIIAPNYRQDNSLVVDRITLPMLAIHNSNIEYDYKRFTYHKALDFLRNHDKGNTPGLAIREKWERDTVLGVAKGVPINIAYKLYAWTSYNQDMNQIIEQIVTKFSSMAYIKVAGIFWEVGVKLDSIENAIEYDPGDQATNVFKYQFNMTAETFIPQPLVRRKAVLKTKVELVNGSLDDVDEVIQRLEDAVKGLK